MKYLYQVLISFFGMAGAHAQPIDCALLFPDSSGTAPVRYIYSGVIDDIHAFRMLLCSTGKDCRGFYEMTSTQEHSLLEGFIKNDSIFLAEYNKTGILTGTIKGKFSPSLIVATRNMSNGKFSGNLEAAAKSNWVMSGKYELRSNSSIVAYKPVNKGSERVLLTYPNDYTCRGIYFKGGNEKTIIFSGKKPEAVFRKFRATAISPGSPEPIILSVKHDILKIAGNNENPDTVVYTPEKSILLTYKEIYEKRIAYEIHYPYMEDDRADAVIARMVNHIQAGFDSVKIELRKKYRDENAIPRREQLVAWFEPTLVSPKWLCGHFIITNPYENESFLVPINYNFLLNKDIDITSLIRVEQDRPVSWTSLAGMDTAVVDTARNTEYFAPAMSYSGIWVSTVFDRVFDRQIREVAVNNKSIRWKWWKPDYWAIRFIN